MQLPPTKSIASIAIAVVSALGYFTAWSLLASPFTAFPGDDAYTATEIAVTGGLSLDQSSILDSPAPVYYLLAYLTLKFCGVLMPAGGCDAGEAILHLSIASNAVIVLLLGLITFRLTENLYIQSIAHAIYAFAAWPVTYHFMVSYTVTTAALVLLVFYLIIVSNRESRMLPSVAGIISALVLWTTPAGPLTVGLLVVTVSFLLWNGNSWRDLFLLSPFDLRRLRIFFVSFLIGSSFFGYFGLQHYLGHLLHNINTPHYADAYQKFGFIPESPFFSYLHILKVYGHVGLMLFMGALVAMPFLVANPIGAGVQKQTIRTVMALTVFVILHALLIDLLPSTKLARTHFPSYPISLITICITGYVTYRWLARSGNAKILSTIFLCVALIAMVYEGVHLSKETRRVRTTATKYLNSARETTDWYLLLEDPHHGLMWTTFNWPLLDIQSIGVSTKGFLGLQGTFKPGLQYHVIRLIEASKVPSLLAKTTRNPIGFVLGPHGRGSGLSVAGHATFADFDPGALLNLDALRPRIKEFTVLPYYMHYPPFLLEEEISEALYFSGHIPDYRAPETGVTLVRF